MIAIIGSEALLHYTTKLGRTPMDLDIVGEYDDVMEAVSIIRKLGKILAQYPIESGKKLIVKGENTILEAEIAWSGSSAEALLEIIKQDKETFHCRGGTAIPSLDVLYLLKMSHRYKKDSPHFLKTMNDISLMRKLGAKIRPEHEEFFKQREADTYKNKLPSLKRSKDDFFSGDGIVYEWDHDTIHEAVKHLDKPAYQYFSGGEVWSDMKIFETLPGHIKLYAVLEESLVLAAERSQLAFPDKVIEHKWSFDMALMKVCSSITGGKFREYAWENYDKVQELYAKVGHDYMHRVYRGIANGVVKRVT